MKIRYQDVKRMSEEMLGYVSTMERLLGDFRKRTDAYAAQIQDSIADQAVSLVAELTTTVKEMRTAIERGVSIALDGAEKLGATERRGSGNIGRI